MSNRDQDFRMKQSKNEKDARLEKLKKLQSKFTGLQSVEQKENQLNPQKDTGSSKKIVSNTDNNSTADIYQLKKDLKAEKELNKSLKKTVFDQKEVIKEYSKSNTSMSLQIEENMKEINRLSKEIQHLEEANSESKSTKLSLENAIIKKTNQELKSRNQYLIKENGNLKREQYLSVYKDQISQLNEIIVNYKSQISSFDNKMEEFRLESFNTQNEVQVENDYLKKIIIDIANDLGLPPFDELLTYLEINLNHDNYREFDKIHNILWKINKIRNKNNYRRRNRRPEYIPQHSIYGYLIKIDNYFMFNSLQGDVYPIDSCRIKLRKKLTEDMPSRASIRDNYARIENIYEDIDVEIGKLENKKIRHDRFHLTEIDRIVEKVTFDIPFKILIVASRNKEEYITKLESHGLEIVWHDSYEEHESRLKDKFPSADVVIICTSHTSHSAINVVDKQDIKVELIKRDNVNTILHRIRYALIRLGMINTGEKSLVAMSNKSKGDDSYV